MTIPLNASIVLALLWLSGCSSTAVNPPSEPLSFELPQYSSAFFSTKEVITLDKIFTLTPAQQEHFLTYYHLPENQHKAGHIRLYDYLSAQTGGFSYKGNTYTATEAYSKQQGNCLSLAILTTALAKLADIDVSYQKMNSAPLYFKHENVMSISSHVRTRAFPPDYKVSPNTIVIRKPSIVIDYFSEASDISGKKVLPEDFIAMFYQNMAAESIIDSDLDLAHAYIQQGLKVSPGNPESLNILAVLLMKKKHSEVASRIYEFLYQTGKGSVTTLSNYALLKERTGDIKGAKALIAEVDKIEDDNPYKWIDVAQRQLKKQHFAIALKYYRKAIETAPYLAEGYFGIANTLYQSGKPESALNYLQQARKLAYIPEQEKRYSAKLYSLKAKLN